MVNRFQAKSCDCDKQQIKEARLMVISIAKRKDPQELGINKREKHCACTVQLPTVLHTSVTVLGRFDNSPTLERYRYIVSIIFIDYGQWQ